MHCLKRSTPFHQELAGGKSYSLVLSAPGYKTLTLTGIQVPLNHGFINQVRNLDRSASAVSPVARSP